MTGKERHHDHDDDRLARLYREQGDIEPGPGVDQRIQAQAREEARPGRLPRPAHWLGGAAAAASLLVVVAVVTNMQPPGAGPPGNEPDKAGDSMPAAESSAFSAGEPSDDDRQPELRSRRAPVAAQAPQSTQADEEEVRPRISSGHERPGASEVFQQMSETGPSPRDELEDELGPIPRPRLDEMQDRSADVDRALWLIERLISVDNAERARAEVETLREQSPGQEIPRHLLRQLEELEADNSDRG